MTDEVETTRVVVSCPPNSRLQSVALTLDQRVTWTGGPFELERGTFRLEPDFLCVEEYFRPLVNELLGDGYIGVVSLGFNHNLIRLDVANEFQSELDDYLQYAFQEIDGVFGTPVTLYLLTEHFSEQDLQAIRRAAGEQFPLHEVANAAELRNLQEAKRDRH